MSDPSAGVTGRRRQIGTVHDGTGCLHGHIVAPGLHAPSSRRLAQNRRSRSVDEWQEWAGANNGWTDGAKTGSAICLAHIRTTGEGGRRCWHRPTGFVANQARVRLMPGLRRHLQIALFLERLTTEWRFSVASSDAAPFARSCRGPWLMAGSAGPFILALLGGMGCLFSVPLVAGGIMTSTQTRSRRARRRECCKSEPFPLCLALASRRKFPCEIQGLCCSGTARSGLVGVGGSRHGCRWCRRPTSRALAAAVKPDAFTH